MPGGLHKGFRAGIAAIGHRVGHVVVGRIGDAVHHDLKEDAVKGADDGLHLVLRQHVGLQAAVLPAVPLRRAVAGDHIPHPRDGQHLRGDGAERTPAGHHHVDTLFRRPRQGRRVRRRQRSVLPQGRMIQIQSDQFCFHSRFPMQAFRAAAAPSA